MKYLDLRAIQASSRERRTRCGEEVVEEEKKSKGEEEVHLCTTVEARKEVAIMIKSMG